MRERYDGGRWPSLPIILRRQNLASFCRFPLLFPFLLFFPLFFRSKQWRTAARMAARARQEPIERREAAACHYSKSPALIPLVAGTKTTMSSEAKLVDASYSGGGSGGGSYHSEYHKIRFVLQNFESVQEERGDFILSSVMECHGCKVSFPHGNPSLLAFCAESMFIVS